MEKTELADLEKRILKLCRKHADISNLCADVILLIDHYHKMPVKVTRIDEDQSLCKKHTRTCKRKENGL